MCLACADRGFTHQLGWEEPAGQRPGSSGWVWECSLGLWEERGAARQKLQERRKRKEERVREGREGA